MMEKELPEGWVEVELSEISLEVKKVTPENSPEEYFNYIDIASIDNNKNKITDAKSILGAEAPSRARQLVREGDTVFSTVRTYLKNIAYITDEFDDSVASTGFAVIRPAELIENKFVFYYTLSDFFLEPLNQLQRGISYPAVKSSVVLGQPLPLPPLAEQKRIVAKLDEAFQHLDSLKARLARIPELLKNFRQAVLTQAVTGKLTEEWREENSFSTSEEMIKSVRSRETSASKRPIILTSDSNDAPFVIPEDWLFINLGLLSEKLTYGTSAKSEDTGEIPVLRMGNLQKGQIDWTDLKYTSDKKEIEKYALKKGDVLFNRTNSPELVGKTSVIDSDKPAIYAGYLIKIWNFPELNSYYLNFVLNSQYAKQWAWEVKTDGVSQSNINAQKLADFLLPLPSEEEQKEIVRKVEALFAKADAIEALYTKAKEKVDKLPQALLAKAFRGELVPQDVQDEPASVLLEKIKVARVAAGKAPQGKGGKKAQTQLAL